MGLSRKIADPQAVAKAEKIQREARITYEGLLNQAMIRIASGVPDQEAVKDLDHFVWMKLAKKYRLKYRREKS